MENENKKIVEVNGIKMELDLRTAKVQTIDTFRVGDPVLLLITTGYGDKTSTMYDGVITGFGAFKENPTIMVSYLDTSYSSAALKHVCINSNTKDIEIVRSENPAAPFNAKKARVALENQIRTKERELEEAQRTLKTYDEFFGMLMSEVRKEA